jgi:hypothetical protein
MNVQLLLRLRVTGCRCDYVGAKRLGRLLLAPKNILVYFHEASDARSSRPKWQIKKS